MVQRKKNVICIDQDLRKVRACVQVDVVLRTETSLEAYNLPKFSAQPTISKCHDTGTYCEKTIQNIYFSFCVVCCNAFILLMYAANRLQSFLSPSCTHGVCDINSYTINTSRSTLQE